jgi:hypothetical protein
LNQAQRAKLSAALPEYIADQMKPFIEGVEAKDHGAPATEIPVQGSQQEKTPAITPPEAVAQESGQPSRWKIKRLSPATSSPGESADANVVSGTVTDTAKIIGEIIDDFRAKWREDRQFRLAAQTIFWLTTTIAITWFAVRAYEPTAANSGKIWSDSFKAFQLLQGR